MSERPSLVLGLMSGTSLDGMDAAVVRFRGPTSAELISFVCREYSEGERALLRRALNGATAPDLARLHVRIAEWGADAADAALAAAHLPASAVDGIAFHGQTIWHEPPLVSWQLGEAAILAERFGRPVINNFRARDVAAGGQGAPLVPIADVLLFAAADHPRVLLNLGGMANLTYVPRRAAEEGVFAFDTGPGVALVDTVARLVDPALPFDRDGVLSATGKPNAELLAELLTDPFFNQPPPKSTGRERFGEAMARAIHARAPGADGVATAVELTARSLGAAVRRWVPGTPEVVVSGGGAHHPGIIRALVRELGPERQVRPFGDLFFPGEAKEAVAFALLGYLTLHGQPGNLPGATGAVGARVLGSITPP